MMESIYTKISIQRFQDLYQNLLTGGAAILLFVAIALIVALSPTLRSVDETTRVALEEHELIKVKLNTGYAGKREEAAALLAEGTRSRVAQIIGRVVVLYRARTPEDPAKPRIRLP